MPKVSVIIATHSRPNLLPRAVRSALEAGTDVEVIVVDDASTDETAEVCRRLENIKYVRVERNQRVAGARNLGILASSAEYISFHDDDDIRIPGSLDKQIAILEANPDVAFVYGKAIDGDENCTPKADAVMYPTDLEGDVFWDLLSRNFIACGTVVFRKKCLYKVGILDKTLHRIDDWDLWVRLSEIFPVKAIQELVYIWQSSTPYSNQGTSNLAEMWSIASYAHKNKWLELPRAKQASKIQRQEVTQEVNYWMGMMLIWEGIQAVKDKNPSITLKDFRAAIQINPKLFFHPKTIFNIVKYSFISTQKKIKK